MFLEINQLRILEGLGKVPVNKRVYFNLKELITFSVPAEGNQ